jgi:pilus assembly protein CpaF
MAQEEPATTAPASKKLYSSADTLGGATSGQIVKAQDRDLILTIRDSVVTELVKLTAKEGGDRGTDFHLELSDVVRTATRHVDQSTHELPFPRAQSVQLVVDEILGTGPIEPLLQNPSVTEVMVVRFDRVYVERNGRIETTTVRFNDEAHLRTTIERIVGKVGRRIDESSPLVDARLLDGSRVNAVIPPIALDGSSLTIRKFSVDKMTLEDLLDIGTLTPEASEYLNCLIRGKANIIISGGTGSGKTTTLNVLASLIPVDQRIVTIEDSAELQLNKPHVVRLESRPANVEGRGTVTIRELVKNSLRMRPDRIIVGEVRDGTAFDMLQAMNTGHDGSLTTVHANSPSDALLRLEMMSLMAGLELPIPAIRRQMASAIDVVMQQTRFIDGRRRITDICEVTKGKTGEPIISPIFSYHFSGGKGAKATAEEGLAWTGKTSTIGEKLAANGVNLPDYLRSGR